MGKRIKDPSFGEQTQYNPDLRVLVDKLDTGTDDWIEARTMKIGRLGNALMQGSPNGTNWHDGVIEGDIYFRVSTDGGESWIPILGKGEQGEEGPSIEPPNWLKGTRDPVPGDGKIGDMWINLDTHDVFEKVEGGVWVFRLTMKGDPGADGIDGKDIEWIFKRTTELEAPVRPQSQQQDDYVPTGWTDDMQGVNDTYKYEYVSKRTKEDGTWSTFSLPRLWAKYSFDGEDGEDGQDGTDIEFIFTQTINSTRPSTPSSMQEDDYVPTGWTDDMQGVSAISPYEWASKRTKSDGMWSSFTQPKLWAKYSFDGTDGTDGADAETPEFRYQKNGSTTSPPAVNKTVLNPAGWSLGMPTASLLEYVWVIYTRKNASKTELLQDWSDPVRLNGIPGPAGENVVAPVMAYQGDYAFDPNVIYYGNSTRVDVVRYVDNMYYITRTDAGSFPANSSNVPDVATDKWNYFGNQFESVATKIFFSELAYINNLGVKLLRTTDENDLNSRIEITNDHEFKVYDENGVQKILIKDGVLNVENNSSRFLRVNAINNWGALAYLRNNDGPGLAVDVTGTGTGLVISSSSTGKALASEGSVQMIQRSGDTWNAPGILHSREIYWNGSTMVTTQSWGSGFTDISITRISQGRYRVTHTRFGFDYMVFANVVNTTSERVCMIQKPTNTEFVINIKTGQNAYADERVNFMIVGNNRTKQLIV